MHIRDILIVVDHTTEAEAGFRYAADLARFHDANLMVLCPIPLLPPVLHMATQFNRDWLYVLQEQLNSEAGRMFTHFSRIAMEAGVDFEWWTEQGEPEEIVVHYSRLVDLVVTIQTSGLNGLAGVASSPGKYLLGTNAPTIILPAEPGTGLPRNIKFAWDDSATAARALKEALPLLQTAKNIELVSVNSNSSDKTDHIGCRANVESYLQHHGIEAERKELSSTRQDESQKLIDHLSESDSDLLVMGAYGHTRFREAVLGGMTKDILRAMPIPLFMTH